jgi:hypothetical protein
VIDVPPIGADERRVRRSKVTDVTPAGAGTYSFQSRLTDRAWHGDFGGQSEMIIHDIIVTGRLEGSALTIKELTVTPVVLPYAQCPGVEQACDQLVGQALRDGWRAAVLSNLGGSRSCTHVTTLMLGLAEVTTQVIFLQMNEQVAYTPTSRRDGSWMTMGLTVAPGLVDLCHALIRDGAVLGPVLTCSKSVNKSVDNPAAEH